MTEVDPQVPTELDVWWAPKSVWTLWKQTKLFFSRAWNRNAFLGRSAHNLVTTDYPVLPLGNLHNCK